ncbi:hypothetical protein AA310_00200 [Arthrobacter sp. YC-RL1]|uniref:hypothetical protein n=1 Tax=Arthrobacter sp. YC-RL1 TaxID=1652545 RepID=UPI00063DD4F6|nr:hypothetical protein [Arthrobacter sp. YC-RL1]ALQ32629.1 hypothetical protein ATC04_18395 [Arthrobacter sp. YC-RL1]KLI90717.1 hypothetical protein AA310_00200 [Arthrobacter sp. YC-RL1]
MVTIETADGKQINAETEVLLASRLADHELGTGWDDGISPFDEHTILGEYLDYIAEFSSK